MLIRHRSDNSAASCCISLLLLSSGCLISSAAFADLEEVRVIRTEPVEVRVCSGAQNRPQPSSGISAKEVAGTAAGALVGGLLGHQVGHGTGRTAATVVGAGAGAYAGYKLTEEKPRAQQDQTTCAPATQYRIHYSRTNGMQGDVMMTSMPASEVLMIDFCGEKPCR